MTSASLCGLIGIMRTGVVMQQQNPFSEEASSLPANGGTKFRQDRAVRGRRNGVVTLLQFGEQYALAIQNTVNMTLPADGVTLNFLCAGDAVCFHCMEASFVSGS